VAKKTARKKKSSAVRKAKPAGPKKKVQRKKVTQAKAKPTKRSAKKATPAKKAAAKPARKRKVSKKAVPKKAVKRVVPKKAAPKKAVIAKKGKATKVAAKKAIQKAASAKQTEKPLRKTRKKRGSGQPRKSARVRFCRQEDCPSEATTSGFCRRHYIQNWKELKLAEENKDERKLSRYVERMIGKGADTTEKSESDEMKEYYESLSESNLDRLIGGIKVEDF